MSDAIFDDLDLATLFDVADEIGDQYLTDEEIAARDAELLAIRTEAWGILADNDLLDLV